MADSRKLTDEELLAQFDNIGTDDTDNIESTKRASTSVASHQSESKSNNTAENEDDENPLAEILKRPSATISRTSTPHQLAPSSTSTSVTGRGKHTPQSSGRNSEEQETKISQSAQGQKILKAPPAPTTSASQIEQEQPAAGSWWGGFSAIVSTARKQAESAYKEIQNNEEAAKWAEQARGNIGVLRGLGAAVGSRALPSFQSLIHTIAPPISQHERLQIHTTHDFSHYPSLDPLIYSTFSRVMAQVEGGDLIVIQRGSESTHKRSANDHSEVYGYTGGSSGWSDGPWWRDTDHGVSPPRSLGAVRGLTEGTKLCRASAEAYASDFFGAKGGIEQAAKQATEALDESNPTRSSDIFLAIQAIQHTEVADLFRSGQHSKSTEPALGKKESAQDDNDSKDVISFAIYLYDPIHSITFAALSQSVPQQWLKWLDAAPQSGASPDQPQFPNEIAAIIEEGGVDPREWAAEWVEEVLSLSLGIVAQSYVARRMGVGEGGLGKGRKQLSEIVESGGGEAARAV